MEAALLLAQTVATAALAGWLTVGVRDNILFPSINETYTTEVFEFARMREEYPEAYAKVAHRAITNRRIQLWAFRLVIVSELTASMLLCAGAIVLALAMFGVVGSEFSRALAMVGVTMFVAVWSAFLVVGNHFCYWFGHEGAQNTHFQLTLCGLATLILLAQG